MSEDLKKKQISPASLFEANIDGKNDFFLRGAKEICDYLKCGRTTLRWYMEHTNIPVCRLIVADESCRETMLVLRQALDYWMIALLLGVNVGNKGIKNEVDTSSRFIRRTSRSKTQSKFKRLFLKSRSASKQ